MFFQFLAIQLLFLLFQDNQDSLHLQPVFSLLHFDHVPTLPFSHEEFLQVISSCHPSSSFEVFHHGIKEFLVPQFFSIHEEFQLLFACHLHPSYVLLLFSQPPFCFFLLHPFDEQGELQQPFLP